MKLMAMYAGVDPKVHTKDIRVAGEMTDRRERGEGNDGPKQNVNHLAHRTQKGDPAVRP